MGDRHGCNAHDGRSMARRAGGTGGEGPGTRIRTRRSRFPGGGHIRVYYDTEALTGCWVFALARVTLTTGWLGKLDVHWRLETDPCVCLEDTYCT